MSENMEKLQGASRLVSQMILFVKVYEAGKIPGPVDFEYDLTAQQVTDLKQAFATARTACKALLDGVTA